MQIGSKLETNLECSQFKSRARLKHYSSTRVRLVLKSKRYEARFLHCQNYPRASIETVLEHDRNKSRAPSKHFPSTVEANLEHDLSYSRARSKQIASTVETILEHNRNNFRARSKQISNTFQANLEQGGNKSRVKSIQVSSTLKILLEHARYISFEHAQKTSKRREARFLHCQIYPRATVIGSNLRHLRNNSRAPSKQISSMI